MKREVTYKRGQVGWALWKYFTFYKEQTDHPPKVFLTRIKRLLELDRSPEVSRTRRERSFAFINEDTEGQGTDVEYTPFNTACLAMGLELLDVGFKQHEIVFLLQHLRLDLEEHYLKILKNPPEIRRQKIPAIERPRSPIFEEDGKSFADCRVFTVINKVEFKELVSDQGEKPHKKHHPIFFKPVFCYGITQLHKEFHQMYTRKMTYRKALVLEIAYTVILVKQFLEEAPLIKRGRK